MTQELSDLSATTLRDKLCRGTLCAEEVLESFITRIEATNPKINALVTLDYASAREHARALDRAMTAGHKPGLLHGLPIAIKDLQLTKGMRTTFGSRIYQDFIPDHDDGFVKALRDQGAVILGKSNTPEFGAGAHTDNVLFGPTRNPHDVTRSAGGSSGGAAAALACSMVALASGSDTGGSLRIPAAFNGVCGLRPSPGRVAGSEHGNGWNGLSLEGPMARTIDDLALFLAAMSAQDLQDPLSQASRDQADLLALSAPDLSSLKIATSADLGFAPIEPVLKDYFDSLCADLIEAGASLTPACPDFSEADQCFVGVRALYFLEEHLERYRHHKDLLGPNVRSNVEQGLGFSMKDAAEALRLQTKLYRQWHQFIEDYDVLICPTCAVSPFEISQGVPTQINGQPLNHYFSWFALTYALSLIGAPVASIPCGTDPLGLPIGLQIAGPRGSDLKVLQIAKAITGARQKAP